MDIRKLQRAIVDGLEDVKAQNIVVFNTEHLSPLFERVIIASGTSNRQTKALASSVRETVKARGLPVLRTEGEDNGEWIIVDCGAAVAHIMQPAIRDYYHLEEIWGGKAVRLKLGKGAAGLAKASEPPRQDVAPARAGAKKTAAGKAPSKKTATATPTASKAPAKKPAAKTSSTSRAPARKTAPGKAAGRGAAAKAPPAGRAVRAKTPAKAPAKTARAGAAAVRRRAG